MLDERLKTIDERVRHTAAPKAHVYPLTVLVFAFFLASCTFVDDYDIDLMQDAVASVETSSSVASANSTGSSSDTETTTSSSRDDETMSSSEVASSSSFSSSSKDPEPVEGSSSSVKNVSSSSEEEMASSSSNEPKSSSSSVPGFICGDSTMSRGGVEYETVKIHNLCWTKKNLEFKPSASEGYMCNGDLESNCEKYGFLYNSEIAQSVCPAGWRLPEKQDITDLLAYIDDSDFAGTLLKAKSGWDGDPGNGTDDFSFTALPGGSCNVEKTCGGAGSVGIWWTSTEKKAKTMYVLKLTGDDEDAYDETDLDKTSFASVRCVRE